MFKDLNSNKKEENIKRGENAMTKNSELLKKDIIPLSEVESSLDIDELSIRLKYNRIFTPSGEKTNKFVLFYKYDVESDNFIDNYKIDNAFLSNQYNIVRIEPLMKDIFKSLKAFDSNMEIKVNKHIIDNKTTILIPFDLVDYTIPIDNETKRNDILFSLTTGNNPNIASNYNIRLNLLNSYNGQTTLKIIYSLVTKIGDKEVDNKLIAYQNWISNLHLKSINFEISKIKKVIDTIKNDIELFRNIKITPDDIEEIKNDYLSAKKFKLFESVFEQLDEKCKNLYYFTIIVSQMRQDIVWVNLFRRFVEKKVKGEMVK